MKSNYLLFIFLLSGQVIFSQTDSMTILYDTVIICTQSEMKAFHSDERCVGLDICEDSLQTMLDQLAIQKWKRKPCCICWENVENTCVNDNLRAYDEEEYNDDYEEDEIYSDAWLWMTDIPYVFFGVVVGSVVLLSNEVYVGTSYAYLPPRLSDFSNSKLTTSVGWDILFRKNLKRDAIEYGFNYHHYEWEDSRLSPVEIDNQTTYLWSLKYLHQLNRYFSSLEQSRAKLKMYLAPVITFGYSEGRFSNSVSQFGIGGSMMVSIPLGKRMHLDFRNEITNFSAEFKVGFRWLYQNRYPWQR